MPGDGANAGRAHRAAERVRVSAGRGRERVLDAVLEQSAERGDPDRHAAETKGVVYPGRHPGSRGIDDAQCRSRERRIRDPDADARDDEAREQRGPA